MFRSAEDPLTAAVFSRLVYLEPAHLWDVLLRATRGALPAGADPVRLVDVQFWPGWSLTTARGFKPVEPDLWMRFDHGRPARRFDLIFECKRGADHDPGQWDREWRAHVEAHPEEDPDRRVALVAVGTWGGASTCVASAIASSGRVSMPEGFRVVPLGWGALADTLSGALAEGRDGRIVSDVLDALALHGHLHATRLADIARPASAAFDRSGRTFAAMALFLGDEPQADPSGDALADWPDRIQGMRPAAYAHAALRRM
ncbi:hypothetical protein [Methylobacterium pseudosasicola]|uniref:hypothetical protein n=1 Tax=Methylobacterium pseudosasicola TaxID=582667 RepID=UPI00111416F7|nr:hypothetical protein [Methylobacterium pseudosasicola]